MLSGTENICSVIDLGTNTCLLLIASIENKKLTTLFESIETPRIGRNLYETGKISEDSCKKVIAIFKNYINLSNKYKASEIHAFGTSALREAVNRNKFIETVKKETGIEIKVISGKQEAECSYEGAIYDLDKDIEYAVLDIGGGSSEICFSENGLIKSESIDIGSVRICEKFFKCNYNQENFLNAITYIGNEIRKLNFRTSENIKLAGVAGTITTLSAIKNGLREFDKSRIHKDKLRYDEIDELIQRLSQMNERERLKIGKYMKGRSDIIICGALILREFMKYFNFKNVIVSAKGLRYGLMLKLSDFK